MLFSSSREDQLADQPEDLSSQNKNGLPQRTARTKKMGAKPKLKNATNKKVFSLSCTRPSCDFVAKTFFLLRK